MVPLSLWKYWPLVVPAQAALASAAALMRGRIQLAAISGDALCHSINLTSRVRNEYNMFIVI